MTERHIYIYGIISPYQDNDSGKYGEVNLKSVVNQIQAAKDADVLKIHIRSEGGDVNEGFAIYDALTNSGKTVETIGEGIVASIATVIFLSGSKRTMSPNAEFLIHNPWTFGGGTSKDMQKQADELKAIEDKLMNFYNSKTGTDIETLKNLMNNETLLTAEQSKNYGFATDVMEVFKAVALFNNSNNLTMTEIEKINDSVDKKLSKFSVILNKLENLFSPVQNLKVTAGDGTVLDFGDQVQEQSEIAVGMTATVEGGGQASGEYVMPDGSKITFEAGKITVITPAVDEGEDLAKENADLKAEIETLKAQNLLAQENLTKATGSIIEMKAEFTALKAQIKTDIESFAPEKKKDGDELVIRKPFKS